MAEPSTNSGNSDVSLDRITSMVATAARGRRLVMEEDSVLEDEDDADDNDEETADDDKDRLLDHTGRVLRVVVSTVLLGRV